MNDFLCTYGLPLAFGIIGLTGLALGIAHAIYYGRGWQEDDYDELQRQQDIEIALYAARRE